MKALLAAFRALLPGLGLGLAGGLLALLAARLWSPPPTFITLDLATVVGEQVQGLVVRTDMDDAGRARASALFAQQLDMQSKAMAAQYHAIVLTAPAVVWGVPDLTGELRQRVQAAMLAQGIPAALPGMAARAAPRAQPGQPAPTGAFPAPAGFPNPRAAPVQGAAPMAAPPAIWDTPVQGGQP